LREAVQVLKSEHVQSDITTHRLEEHQVDSLIEHARSSGADLIVMSSERAGTFDKVFHRSFAEKLARGSSCPVLVMAGDTEVTPPLRSVLIATDYSESSRRAAYAAREIIGDDGIITFQHVWGTRPYLAMENHTTGKASPPQANSVELACHAELEKLQNFVSELRFTDIETNCYVSGGVAEEEIARLADEISADIIVVGSRPHEDWSEKLFGTVTDRLIEISRKPVLAVPAIATVMSPMSRLDQTLSESFPASDPGSSWAGSPS
jgi:nucleotide-binding universal stress UspA family protein